MSPSIRKLRSLLSAPRLGIEIDSGSVRGVLVNRSRIVNTATVARADSESLDAALRRVLDALRCAVWRRPRVFVAIGPAASQLRRLVNLPAVTSAHTLRAMVRSNAGRFFLKNGVPLLTSSVMLENGGCGWAAALEEPPVRAVAEACRSSRLRLELAAPTIVALRRGLEDECLTAVDGDVVMRAHLDANGGLQSLRRLAVVSIDESEGSAAPVAALRALGARATMYAASYGVTRIDYGEPLVVQGRELRAWREVSVPRWRMLLACSSLCLVVLSTFAFPALYAKRVATRTTQKLAVIDREYRKAHWMQAELARTTASLAEIEAFKASRRSTVQFIADLTAALPPDTWLQSLHVDSEGGTLSALAPRAAVPTGALADLKSITSPMIVGAVSSEQRGSDRIERVTLRFRWKSSERKSASAARRAEGDRR